jgi:phage baseplate assembly protein W
MTTKIIPGYRLARTYRGDTLQRVASRELGDAARWYDLIDFNRLLPPYIVDDPSDAGPRVLLAGDSLRIPTNNASIIQDEATDDLFGVDVRLKNGKLFVENGNLSTVADVDNLNQSLRHLVVTEQGELLYHSRYGCGTRAFIGASNSRANGLVAGSLVRRAVLADSRIASVQSALVEQSGDALKITIKAEAINAVPITVEAVT